MSKTFFGGVKFKGFKQTRSKPIKHIDEPHSVAIPLNGSGGINCTPNVSKREKVSVGQMIGIPSEEYGCPVFASVSGFVRDIEVRKADDGSSVTYVIIDNDFKNDYCDYIRPHSKALLDTSDEEFITLIKNAGIVGAYSGIPVCDKLTESAGNVRRIVINCMESEPFVTSGYRLLLERTLDVINGTKVLIKITGANGAVIAVDESRSNVIKALSENIKDKNLIDVRPLKSKFPQGEERQLIYSIFNGIELPVGKKAYKIGCLVFNPETAANVFTSIATGVPVIKKLITVGGDAIENPSNVSVPIGTSFRDVIDFCGGFTEEPEIVINGGPITGRKITDLDEVVTGSTCAITAFKKSERDSHECFRCGKCVSVCPMRLLPPYINENAAAGNFEKCVDHGIAACIECGCCGYVCPAKVPLLDRIRNAKKEIAKAEERKKEGEAD